MGEKVRKITNYFENLHSQVEGVKWVQKEKVNSKLSKQAGSSGGLMDYTGEGVGEEVQTGLKQEVGELAGWGGGMDIGLGK